MLSPFLKDLNENGLELITEKLKETFKGFLPTTIDRSIGANMTEQGMQGIQQLGI